MTEEPQNQTSMNIAAPLKLRPCDLCGNPLTEDPNSDDISPLFYTLRVAAVVLNLAEWVTKRHPETVTDYQVIDYGENDVLMICAACAESQPTVAMLSQLEDNRIRRAGLAFAARREAFLARKNGENGETDG